MKGMMEKGYPDGLKGEEIPISAQIVSLADAYDKLTRDRVNKKGISHKDAMNILLHERLRNLIRFC